MWIKQLDILSEIFLKGASLVCRKRVVYYFHPQFNGSFDLLGLERMLVRSCF